MRSIFCVTIFPMSKPPRAPPPRPSPPCCGTSARSGRCAAARSSSRSSAMPSPRAAGPSPWAASSAWRSPSASPSAWCAPRWRVWRARTGSWRDAARAARRVPPERRRRGALQAGHAPGSTATAPALAGTGGGRWCCCRRRRPHRRLREELRWLGFGQLRPRTVRAPAGTPAQARAAAAQRAPRDCKALLLYGTGARRRCDRALLALGWDLRELARGYRRFVSASPRSSPLFARTAGAGAAFLVRTLLIHEYRKVHLKDPLLPPALLPGGWVGAAAYELCRRLLRTGVSADAERYLSGAAHRLSRPLPAAVSAAQARVSGWRAHSARAARRGPAWRLSPPAAQVSTKVCRKRFASCPSMTR